MVGNPNLVLRTIDCASRSSKSSVSQSTVGRDYGPWLSPVVFFITGGVAFLLAESIIFRVMRSIFKSPDTQFRFVRREHCASIESGLFSCLPTRTSEGWMNELVGDYDENIYHVSFTTPVHVRIDGRYLILSNTKPRPGRGAIWNERPLKSVVIIEQRYYDLVGCDVCLLPENIARTKVWGKKYPICLNIKCIAANDFNGKKTLPGEEINVNIDVAPGATRIPYADTDEDLSVAWDDEEDWDKTEEETEDRIQVKVEDQLATAGFRMIGELIEDPEDDDKDDHLLSNVSYISDGKARLYLFGRTARQKEEWYRRLTTARKGVERKSLDPCLAKYMTVMKSVSDTNRVSSESFASLNAIVARMYYDVQNNALATALINKMIRKKLDSIKLPTIIGALEMLEFQLGDQGPVVRNAFPPFLDKHGLWTDFHIYFSGQITVKVRTSINLLDTDNPDVVAEPLLGQMKIEDTKEAQDLLQSSTKATDFSGKTAYRKFMRLVEKITQSKRFKKAVSDNRLLHRAVSSLADKKMIISININGAEGIFTINNPPPGTDRLWVGFRGVPRLSFKVEPWLGDRRFGNKLVCSFIEAVIRKKIQKIAVLPNMLDIMVPGLHSASDYSQLRCFEKLFEDEPSFSDSASTANSATVASNQKNVEFQESASKK